MSMIDENFAFADEDKIQDGGNDRESYHTGQQDNSRMDLQALLF